MTRYRCLQCLDGRWACAEHPPVAWDEGRGCPCGAEGAPCPACNPEARMPPGTVIQVTATPDKDGEH